MFLLSFLLFYSLLLPSAACPTGCECVSDPLSTNGGLLANCHWTATSGPVSLVNSTLIRNVRISCDDFTVPHDLFAEGNAVQNLRIEGCRLADLTDFFKPLSSLRTLTLDKVSHNGPSLTLREGSLVSLARLEKFQIVQSGIERLPSDTFCVLKNLQVLNVSSNGISSLKTDSSCQAAQLIIADFSRNQINKIGDHLQSLPALRQLSLSYNRISVISPNSLAPVAHLQQLDLQGNQIEKLDLLPDTLIHINLAYNRLSALPTGLLSLRSLVSLNVSYNKMDLATSTELATSLLESFDASANRIRQLPAGLLANSHGSLVHLQLEGNQIDKLQANLLSNFTKLQTLNLASNRLKVLQDEVFTGIQHLASLKLANNSIDTIENSAFADLAIDELDLSSNRLTESPMAISRLYKLKRINLSGNKISRLFQFVFNKIPHLHSVDLSHNELPSVSQYVFSDCSHLSLLDLSYNQISVILKDALAKCPQLKRLDLSYNRIDSLEDSLITCPSVRRLDVSFNRLAVIQWDSLPARLEVLNADENRIGLLGAAYKSRVRIASLKNNQIELLTADQVPNSMENIDFTGNRIQQIAAGTFGSKNSLRRLILSDNSLASLAKDSVEVLEAVQHVEVELRGNPLQCSCQLQWINTDLAKSRLRIADASNATCAHSIDGRPILLSQANTEDLLCNYQKTCDPGCPCCAYGNCDCKSVCPTGCRCFHDVSHSKNIVLCVNLSHTDMQSFSPSDVPMSATHVYLSALSLPILRSSTFLGREKLEQLRINGSGVRIIQPKAFNMLKSLKLVDLSDNLLTNLTGEEFRGTPLLSHLFLNGNQLDTVEKTLIDALPELQLVTLHNNLLADISPALASSPVRSLSLAGNPFRCDCDSAHYSAPFWLHANRQKIADFDHILCVENVTKAFRENDTTVLSAFPPNQGFDIFKMPMNEFLRDFNRSICTPISHGFFGQEPQSSILIILVIVACVFLICALVIVAVRRTHYAVNQRRYKTSSLNCSTTPGSSPLPLPLINYDAFVSYSKRDERMVQDLICRRLEDQDYSLCLLHRDGPAHNHSFHSVSDELIGQMDASQALVLILTKNFLQEEWKTLQIKTSHQLFAKNRQKRVIAVFCDGVDQNLLDDELGQILRKNTTIRMSDPLFWTLLMGGIPRTVTHHSGSSDIYSDMYCGIVPSNIV